MTAKIMRISHFAVAAVAMLGLTGCAPPGYDEAPKVSAHLTQLMPKAKREKVDEVAVCYDQKWMDSHWFATMKMEDGGIYHYKLQVPFGKVDDTKPVEREFFNTESWRFKRRNNGYKYEGCFDHRADYLLELDGGRVTAYVDGHVVVSSRFDDGVKELLARAAQATELAAAAHKNHVPVETTWGLKP